MRVEDELIRVTKDLYPCKSRLAESVGKYLKEAAEAKAIALAEKEREMEILEGFTLVEDRRQKKKKARLLGSLPQ